MSKLALTAAICGLLALSLGACSEAKAATINEKCPMMGEAVSADGGTVDYKGQKVGFCCEGCAPKFQALDEAAKAAALEKAGVKAQ